MAEQIKKLYFSLQLRRHKTRPLAYLIPLLCTYLTVCERRISTVLPHRRERQQDRPTIHPTINFVRNSTFPQLTPNALVLSGCNPPSPSPFSTPITFPPVCQERHRCASEVILGMLPLSF